MLANQYDLDCTTWNPQGHLFQAEYAMKAVELGSTSLGLRSKDHVVLAALLQRRHDLAMYQNKIFSIDDHMGASITGLTADGRLLVKYMRGECLNHHFTYGSKHQLYPLMSKIGEKSQMKTQKSNKRPYGVGLLVAGSDKTGVHLYETKPDGNFYEYYAIAIGQRCQSAKTYLEKHFQTFPDASLDELIDHAIRAIKASAQQKEINGDNVNVAYVGKDKQFCTVDKADIQAAIDKIVAENEANQPEGMQVDQ